jgi:hypothetical protein
LFADGRLGDAEAARRPGETAGLDDMAKDHHAFQVFHFLLFSIR